MKQFVPYENRPLDPPQSRVSKWQYCVCGHYWHEHKVGTPERYRNFLHRITSFWDLDGACTKCMCPDYDELGKFTDEELIKMKEEEMIHG